MAGTRPRDLLTDAVLGQLGGCDGADEATLARDLRVLRAAGYLSVTLPAQLGGLDCTLRQAACGQRRLAGFAPLTARAVSAHLYWTGAAADACRSGDASVEWIAAEAAQGATFGAGHGRPGDDLRFASPDSRCAALPGGGYEFRNAAARGSMTPDCDWAAVHAITDGAGAGRDAVLAFAGRAERGEGGYRVARVLPTGAPSDVFTTSAIGWGCALLASVEFSAARQAFRRAVAGAAPGALDQWPAAEASLRLDALKDRIAQLTHAWPRVPEPGPDLGGQHLIGVYAMRHEVDEGSRRVRELAGQISSASPRVPARQP
jgi:hypothetical protein